MTGNLNSADASSSQDQRAPLRVRWLGRVDYTEAWDLQQALFSGVVAGEPGDHLLLLEHPPVYTLGVRGDETNILVDPESVGAELHRVNRGGDVTFHGPGQLVGYPIMDVAGKRGGGMADTVVFVTSVEQIVIDVVADLMEPLGRNVGRLVGYPGVWIDHESDEPRKVAAVGVRLSRGRSMHGFALNVSVDHGWFDHIVPCGIADKAVTSLAAEGLDISMAEVADLIAARAAAILAPGRPVERADVAWRHTTSDLSAFSRGEGPGEAIKPERPSAAKPERAGVAVQLGRRLDQAGVTDGMEIGARKPEWMRVKLSTGENYRKLKQTSRDLGLVTVCEEAGCPNIFDCWNEGTATFMLLGERCTRACGFCLVDTRKPEAVDTDEPVRVAKAIADLGIDFAVLTMVARDDLADGGAHIVAESVREIRRQAPGVGVEVLISDLRGSADSLRIVTDSKPDIVNHNIETVARLQRAVRPSASYARSLTLLARAKADGATTKSGIIVGMGEKPDEVEATLADLAAVGVDVVTIGQYLRPTTNHLPIQRWVTPDEFAEFKRIGEALGISHVESSPLTRSSHHAGSVADSLNA